MEKIARNIVLVIMVMFAFGANAVAQQTKSEAENRQASAAQKAYFSLEKKAIDFGSIKMGTTKTIELAFTNTGKKTLVLTNVYTTCGCTTVDWPKDPFLPGKSGVVKITYNPTENGPFQKSITISTNAENSTEVIQIEGVVM